MKIAVKVLITDVVAGKSADYVQGVDLETGGTLSLQVQQGTARELPKLTPIEVVAEVKPGRYGLQVRSWQVKQ